MMKRRTILLLLLTAALGLLAQTGRAQTVVELTPEEFAQQVYDYKTAGPWKYLGEKPAVVDFYTPWCIHCRALKPRLKKLAEEYPEEIIVYTINGDKAPNLARMLGIQAYPTLLFIPMEEIPTMSVGALSMEALRKGVDTILLKKETE